MVIPVESSFWTRRRIAVLAVTLVLSLLSARSALTAVTARSAPSVALAVSPASPAALVGKGEANFLAALTSGKTQPIVALGKPAKRALEEQPLSPLAIRQLAYAQLLAGREKQGNRLLALARTATRRDFGVQLWSIEKAVERNDLNGAIRGYVSTMDVLDESWGILFPRLGAALGNDEIVEKLAPYIRSGGRWVVPFLNATLATPGSELPVVRLMKKVGQMPPEVRSDGFDKSLARVLLARGRYAEARAYYLSLPYAKPSLLEDVTITSQTAMDQHGPLAWQLSDQLSTGAVMDSDSTISAFADDSVRGVVARKVLYLPAGDYRFSQRYGDVEMPDGGFVQWELLCVDGNGVASSAWKSAEIRPKAGALMQFSVAVPSGCVGQTMQLLVAGGIDRNRTNVTLTVLKIVKSPNTTKPVGA